jgi:dihydroflavonol-4-reductase
MQQTKRYAIGAYKQSKIAAERIVEELITSQDLPAIIVHPTAPIGPRDQRPTPTGRIVIEAASGRIPGFVDTGLNVVHVDDVANGHLAALCTPSPETTIFSADIYSRRTKRHLRGFSSRDCGDVRP